MGTVGIIAFILCVLMFIIGCVYFIKYAHFKTSGWWCLLFFTLSFINMMVFAYEVGKISRAIPKVQYYECKIIYTLEDGRYVKDSVYIKINKNDLHISE